MREQEFGWREYLAVAQQLIGQEVSSMPSGEARQRAAVSRAYYAAMHAAKKLVELDDPTFTASGEAFHRQLVSALEYNSNPRKKKLSSSLNRLRLERVDADYNLNPRTRRQWNTLAPMSIAKAKYIIEQSEGFAP